MARSRAPTWLLPEEFIWLRRSALKEGSSVQGLFFGRSFAVAWAGVLLDGAVVGVERVAKRCDVR